MTVMDSDKRLYMNIGNQLKHRITEGEFNVGDKLPTEKELCDAYKASRTVIREAVIMLEVEGYIEKIKGSGIFVINNQDRQSVISEEEYAPFELLQARQAIESTVASIAASFITRQDALTIKTALEEEKQELARGIYQGDGDYHFHLAVAQATQNQLLVNTVSHLWQLRKQSKMWQQLTQSISNQKYANDWIDDHEKIFKCLIQKDAEGAKNAMWQHFENIKNRLYMLSDTSNIENCFLP